jgi:mono/diheme cytochrome c family protein
MRWNRWVVLALVLVTLIMTILSCMPASKPAGTAVAAKEDPLVRGKRLVYTSGCVDCHTPGSLYGMPDTTRLLSGSELGWQGPWGVSFPRNLTPDSTGLAAWSEDDIVKALRTGTRPNGTVLLPPMPWPSYAWLTDDDAHAIAAYLKSLPPVKYMMPAVVPPGQKFKGSMLVFPPPPAWDAQNLPPPPSK